MGPLWIRVLVAATLVAGCNLKPIDSADAGSRSDARTADPLSGTRGEWTWVDVPGMTCDDGTPTGVAVNHTSAALDGGMLFIYFMGGGACWDAASCFVLNASVHGPFGKAQWDANAAAVSQALDRQRQTNPFRAASYVFIPYCTGDLHAGNNVATYDVLGTPRTMAHVGRRNVEALLPRIQATWPTELQVVVSGSSAGGFGATLNYDLFRRAYPNAQVMLVDDSGPFLESDGVPADERSAWWTNWRLGDVVDPLCADCRGDMSKFYTALVGKYQSDRMALLSSLQDQVIRTYFLILLGPDFEQRLRALVADRLAPTPNFRTFVIPGESHTMLGTMDTTNSGGVTVETWLNAMVTGDAWGTLGL